MANSTTTQKRTCDELNEASDQKRLRRPIADGPRQVSWIYSKRTCLNSHSLSSKTATVIVGADEQKYTFSEDRLCSGSELFREQFEQKEKKDHIEIKLPNAKPRAFEIYLKWFHIGYFYITEDDDSQDFHEGAYKSDNEWSKWSECYELGAYLKDCDFRDACIDMAQDKMISEDTCLFDLDKAIYPHSTSYSPHRNFAVEIATHNWETQVFANVPDDDDAHAPEFLMDLVAYMGIMVRSGAIIKEDTLADFFGDVCCRYHEHAVLMKPCYKDKLGFLL